MNKFESEISRAFKVKSSEPLPDILDSCPYKYTKLVVNLRESYGVKTPCDALVDVYTGPNLALELKQCAIRGSIPFSRIPEHQEQGLLTFDILGRRSFILICFRISPVPKKTAQTLSPGVIRTLERRRAFAIPIKTYLHLKNEELAKGKKSLSPAIIEDQIEIPLIKDQGILVWDISVLKGNKCY